MTIVEFLEARIAEDEAVARVAATQDSQSGNRGPGEWWVKNEDVEADPLAVTSVGGCRVYTRGDSGSNHSWTLASVQHIARHDPARVLRECAAKRAIVERHRNQEAEYEAEWEFNDGAVGSMNALEDVVRALAAVYADHADFDPAWSA